MGGLYYGYVLWVIGGIGGNCKNCGRVKVFLYCSVVESYVRF